MLNVQLLIESKLKKYFYLKNFHVKHFSNSFIHKICGKRMRIQRDEKVFILFTKCWKGEKSLFGAEILVRPNKPETFKIIRVIKN